jgi:hypothetical protein
MMAAVAGERVRARAKAGARARVAVCLGRVEMGRGEDG